MTQTEMRLTELSHGGGCGCKISPAVLSSLLARVPAAAPFSRLLVGSETADDAAVWKLSDDQALIATTDFFMPIVDDPFDFGRIAAANALSDVYAMGGTPILALAIVGMPLEKMSVDTIGRILAGGASVCELAGIPIAGGHSIDAPEPIYGLVAIGLVRPDEVKRNCTGRAGDALILSKGLGIGILGTAMKKGVLDAAGYAEMLGAATLLNRAGAQLGAHEGVHAMTDVTGFGLLGHLLEMCRGSGVGARIEFGRIPLLKAAASLAQQGIGPGAIVRNLASFASEIDFAATLEGWQRNLLADAQTSGGLLVACAPEAVDQVREILVASGAHQTELIGTLEPGACRIAVAP